MRTHVLGLFVATVTFFLGLVSAPVRFESLETSREFTKDLEYTCTIENLVSSNKERVISWTCAFEKENEADRNFTSAIGRYHVLSSSADRAVVSYSVEDSVGYCILRIDGDRRDDICSKSLPAILAFENQRF